MSTKVLEQRDTAAGRPTRMRRRGRVERPGLSLLSQGEPQVWLTGGALAVSLCMIVFLLGLVVYYGVRTFWPVRLVRFELRDGTSVLGEVSDEQDYVLTRETAQALPPAFAPHALALLGDAPQIEVHRHQLRTGNARITGTHYTWVSDVEVADGGTSEPPWSVVAERLEWGRFFGEPIAFISRDERPRSDVEVELGRVLTLLQSGPLRLDETIRAELVAQIDSQSQAVAALRAELDAERERSSRAFLETAPVGEGAAEWAILENGTAVAPRDVPRGQPVAAVESRWTGSEQAWDRYQQMHRGARARFYQQQRLRRVDIGRIDAKAEAARIELRNQELRHNAFGIVVADELFAIETQLAAQQAELQSFTDSVAWLRQRSGTDAQLVAALERLVEALRGEQVKQARPLDERATLLRQQAADLPPEMRETLDTYLSARRESTAAQAAIEVQIDKLQRENNRHRLDMVTAQQEQLTVLSSDLSPELDRGRLPDALREAVHSAGVILEADASLEPITPQQAWRIVRHGIQSRPLVVRRLPDNSLAVFHYVERPLSLGDVVRAYPANQLSWWGRLRVFASRWREFLWDDPREANESGGVFPAIVGTVTMTLIMSLMVVPFGVLAALYLREYARGGLIVSVVRIAINNLAGVPSIVFGVFGLGFFCYVVGAYVDGGPRNANVAPWPVATWWSTLVGLGVLAAVAMTLSFLSLSRGRSAPRRWGRVLGFVLVLLWVAATALAIMVILKAPYFHGLFRARLPNPTFGKGGLLWASLTLALLTLPVVIVATEEALASVPNSLREGSYACGAGKWQTIRRIVLPHAMPGIMTGMILAMARGAGEVAPLMLVGAVKLVRKLPVDGMFPFVHPSRGFMHLGFHIFDLGFQSPNSEAAKPMVFTTTLLLIAIVAVLNFSAVALRARLRRRFGGGHF